MCEAHLEGGHVLGGAVGVAAVRADQRQQVVGAEVGLGSEQQSGSAAGMASEHVCRQAEKRRAPRPRAPRCTWR